ncbi:interferon a3-like [Antennarius striatus]|uniref:interferon a3-like n=1 Tax=Antennarius striatus TaxID=241820 RepID=UPI0035B21C6E
MLNRVFFICLSLSLYCEGAFQSCRWIDNRFKQCSEKSLALLDSMARNSTNPTEDAAAEDTVAFPNNLYHQASNASAEDKINFLVQMLNQTSALFEEDQSTASWKENTAENLINILTRQADGLRACFGSHGHKNNKKLNMYFKRLSSHILKKMGYSAEAWELIRKEIKTHLMRADLLVSSLLATN